MLASCKTVKLPAYTADASSDSFKLSSMLIDAKRESFAGNTAKAEELLRKCLDQDPGYSIAWYELSFIQQTSGKMEDAISSAAKAYKFEPSNIWYQKRFALLLEENKQYKEALGIYRVLEKSEPDSYDHPIDIARLLILSNKHAEAIKVYDELEKKIGVREELSLEKERLYLLMGKPDKAIIELEKLILAFPQDLRYKGMLAEIYESTGQQQNAFRLYKEMMASDPGNGLVHLSLAGYYSRNGEKAKALDETMKAFSSEGVDIDSKMGIMVRYYSNCERDTSLLDEAGLLLNLLEDTHPLDAKVYAIQADFLLLGKKYPEARDKFRKVITLDSLRFPVWENLLMLNEKLNDFPALLQEATRALEIFPEQGILYYLQALAMKELKMYDEAIESLMLTKSLSGKNTRLLVSTNTLLGDVYMAKGNKEKALSFYRMAKEMNPSSESLKKKIDEVQ